MKKIHNFFILTLIALTPAISSAQELKYDFDDTSIRALGNADLYVGSYLNTNQSNIHRGLTQANKNDQPDINLASIGLEASGTWTSRIIFQAGTSVNENYSGEKNQSIKYIQEANIGRKISDKLSVLAGIYPGHIGLESFVSMDNQAYTRSFHAEFSPYYQRGARLRYQSSEDLKFELHALSGYQEISETRLLPALGTLAQYGKDGDFQISHTLYLGHRDAGTRALNNLVLKIPLNSIFSLNLIGDFGIQDSKNTNGIWGGLGSIFETKLSEQLSLILRAEKFVDNKRVVTGFSEKPLDMNGLSLGLNYKPWENIFVRGEARSILSSNKIFAEEDTTTSKSTFFVSSLGLTF